MNDREMLAFTAYLGDICTTPEDVAYQLKRWNDIYKPTLTEPHTDNMGITCTRCVIEGYYKLADAVLAMNDGG